MSYIFEVYSILQNKSNHFVHNYSKPLRTPGQVYILLAVHNTEVRRNTAVQHNTAVQRNTEVRRNTAVQRNTEVRRNIVAVHNKQEQRNYNKQKKY
jgi:hypothetical protein